MTDKTFARQYVATRAALAGVCVPDCDGWKLVECDYEEGQKVARCLVCEKFKTDDEAADHVWELERWTNETNGR